MSDRGGVRSSARLSGESTAAIAAPAAARTAPQGRGRPVSTTAAAAQRRARAAERAAEVEDSPRVLRDKCRRLARALRNAKHLVVYTGAGISTAADIPDYRGPHGVWTRLQRGETVGRVEVSRAQPTFTHMALTALWARGALKFVVSQNCDGLHLRAGLPRRALAELHGDMFAELCAPCRRVYLRAFDTTERTARHAHGTRRLCHACGAELRDSIVHFGERGRAAWPLNWAGALRHAARADVVLCLGSSLKVLRRYPRLWRMQSAPRARPALYIVNLQWTPKDSVAALKINARCDAVMQQVARRLRLRVPRYRAALDPVLAHAEPLAEPEAHTTRRVPLQVPREPDARADHWEPSSPSASDSDEELPLGHLAARLRAEAGAAPSAAPAPGPTPAPAPPPQSNLSRLVLFQVSMHSGEATILLRAEHAAPDLDLLRLRRFRMPRVAPAHSRLRRLLEYEPRIQRDADDDKPAEAELRPKLEPKLEPELRPKLEGDARVKDEPKEEASTSESAGSLAAAIIRRAVLLCRASLYPGLHTIIAPPAAPPPECAWCARHYAARRCLWYGPPREPPPAARVWRRARGRRYLCACCGGPDAPRADPDDGGWYGKGYRKGRRRRR
ncbi:NAD-dependent protein deacetylase sirtuin-7-like [Spodoptera frugiperda]|uniref:protein acetyllysine N-acetyltransferase n=1 Tax=Spodoptera frugiperda TaxID=7108 RepID=A0A9R0EE05_SPOFR|nr:NAD-dependent protein deacetylase sirtuin-7-like [Spodoptera frugiperda]